VATGVRDPDVAAVERRPERTVEAEGAAGERPYPRPVARIQLCDRVAVVVRDPDVAAVERHPFGRVEAVKAAGGVRPPPREGRAVRRVGRGWRTGRTWGAT